MSYDSSMNINICKPCQDDSNETLADGWCRECDEYMCTTCFRHHCKSKFCKEHVLLEKKSTSPNSLNQSVEGLERCKQHSKKSVKFYCAAHNMCGCSVCMIIEHKACDVVYIPQKAAEFESSKDVKSFEENLQKCSSQITACLSEIRNNIDANLNVHNKFTLDVQEFRDSLIDHVNQLAADICAESNEYKDKSVQEQTELTSKATVVQRNLQSMEESFKADKCQPNKLFVKFESLKNALEEMSTTIRDLRKQNTTERYFFRKDSLIESVLDKCKSIGCIQFKNDEVDAGSDFIPENAMPGNGKQSRGLKDLTQRVEFLQIDDDCLRYTHFGDSNGIFIGNTKMTTKSYFELEILHDRKGGSVAIGLVPVNYPVQQFPDWRKGSVAYHSDDGRIFNENKYGAAIAPCSESDKMGCGILSKEMFCVNVFFTKNGQKIGETKLLTTQDLYPAIAIDTNGQVVKVNLNAQSPV